MPKFCGHVLASFEEVRNLAGWDATITSRTRTYPDGKWRLSHIRSEMDKVARKSKHALDPKASSVRINDYLALNMDKRDTNFSAEDLDTWHARLRHYTMGEMDRGRGSGFVV